MKDVTKLGNIADIYDGPHATPKKIENGKYFLSISSLDNGSLDLSKSAFISDKDFIKWTKRVQPQKGDLLFSYETRLGEAALMPDNLQACLGRRMGLLRPKKDKVIPQYLLFAYLSPEFQKVIRKNTIKGATVDRIALNELGNFPIYIPDLKTQQSIAAVLSALDKKIALNKQINAHLEEMAKTLYDYWFVQFDFPDANGKPYKSSGGEMVFDETLKREIPKGWEVKKIESILTIGSGFPFNSKDYTDRGKYQIVTIKNVQDTYLDLTKTDKVGKIPNNIKEFCILKKGDILISLTGNVGRICFVDMNNLLLNQRVGKFICHKEYLHFFYLLFNRSESKERLEKLANGSSQSNLSPIEAVKDLFVCPSNIVLEQFNAKVDLLFEKLLLNQQQNYT